MPDADSQGSDLETSLVRANQGNIHNHVANWPQASHRGYYRSLDVFNCHQHQRRKGLVIDQLRADGRDVYKRTAARLEKELKDLGITIGEDDLRRA